MSRPREHCMDFHSKNATRNFNICSEKRNWETSAKGECQSSKYPREKAYDQHEKEYRKCCKEKTYGLQEINLNGRKKQGHTRFSLVELYSESSTTVKHINLDGEKTFKKPCVNLKAGEQHDRECHKRTKEKRCARQEQECHDNAYEKRYGYQEIISMKQKKQPCPRFAIDDQNNPSVCSTLLSLGNINSSEAFAKSNAFWSRGKGGEKGSQGSRRNRSSNCKKLRHQQSPHCHYGEKQKNCSSHSSLGLCKKNNMKQQHISRCTQFKNENKPHDDCCKSRKSSLSCSRSKDKDKKNRKSSLSKRTTHDVSRSNSRCHGKTNVSEVDSEEWEAVCREIKKRAEQLKKSNCPKKKEKRSRSQSTGRKSRDKHNIEIQLKRSKTQRSASCQAMSARPLVKSTSCQKYNKNDCLKTKVANDTKRSRSQSNDRQKKNRNDFEIGLNGSKIKKCSHQCSNESSRRSKSHSRNQSKCDRFKTTDSKKCFPNRSRSQSKDKQKKEKRDFEIFSSLSGSSSSSVCMDSKPLKKYDQNHSNENKRSCKIKCQNESECDLFENNNGKNFSENTHKSRPRSKDKQCTCKRTSEIPFNESSEMKSDGFCAFMTQICNNDLKEANSENTSNTQSENIMDCFRTNDDMKCAETKRNTQRDSSKSRQKCKEKQNAENCNLAEKRGCCRCFSSNNFNSNHRSSSKNSQKHKDNQNDICDYVIKSKNADVSLEFMTYKTDRSKKQCGGSELIKCNSERNNEEKNNEEKNNMKECSSNSDINRLYKNLKELVKLGVKDIITTGFSEITKRSCEKSCQCNTNDKSRLTGCREQEYGRHDECSTDKMPGNLNSSSLHKNEFENQYYNDPYYNKDCNDKKKTKGLCEKCCQCNKNDNSQLTGCREQEYGRHECSTDKMPGNLNNSSLHKNEFENQYYNDPYYNKDCNDKKKTKGLCEKCCQCNKNDNSQLTGCREQEYERHDDCWSDNVSICQDNADYDVNDKDVNRFDCDSSKTNDAFLADNSCCSLHLECYNGEDICHEGTETPKVNNLEERCATGQEILVTEQVKSVIAQENSVTAQANSATTDEHCEDVPKKMSCLLLETSPDKECLNHVEKKNKKCCGLKSFFQKCSKKTNEKNQKSNSMHDCTSNGKNTPALANTNTDTNDTSLSRKKSNVSICTPEREASKSDSKKMNDPLISTPTLESNKPNNLSPSTTAAAHEDLKNVPPSNKNNDPSFSTPTSNLESNNPNNLSPSTPAAIYKDSKNISPSNNKNDPLISQPVLETNDPNNLSPGTPAAIIIDSKNVSPSKKKKDPLISKPVLEDNDLKNNDPSAGTSPSDNKNLSVAAPSLEGKEDKCESSSSSDICTSSSSSDGCSMSDSSSSPSCCRKKKSKKKKEKKEKKEKKKKEKKKKEKKVKEKKNSNNIPCPPVENSCPCFDESCPSPCPPSCCPPSYPSSYCPPPCPTVCSPPTCRTDCCQPQYPRPCCSPQCSTNYCLPSCPPQCCIPPCSENCLPAPRNGLSDCNRKEMYQCCSPRCSSSRCCCSRNSTPVTSTETLIPKCPTASCSSASMSTISGHSDTYKRTKREFKQILQCLKKEEKLKKKAEKKCQPKKKCSKSSSSSSQHCTNSQSSTSSSSCGCCKRKKNKNGCCEQECMPCGCQYIMKPRPLKKSPNRTKNKKYCDSICHFDTSNTPCPTMCNPCCPPDCTAAQPMEVCPPFTYCSPYCYPNCDYNCVPPTCCIKSPTCNCCWCDDPPAQPCCIPSNQSLLTMYVGEYRIKSDCCSNPDACPKTMEDFCGCGNPKPSKKRSDCQAATPNLENAKWCKQLDKQMKEAEKRCKSQKKKCCKKVCFFDQ